MTAATMPMPFSTTAPTLAFTASSPDASSRLRWVSEHAYAVEFSPDPERPDLLPQMVQPFLQADLSVRFHTRYFQYELGHADKHRARTALDVHMQTLSAMTGLGEPVVTVHTGLDPTQPVSFSRIAGNLSRLVEYARELNITVCLENLRRGHSSDPRNVMAWAEASGAMITLDIGHALGSDCVLSGRHRAEEFVDLFSPRLFEAHVYAREDAYGHHPITDMAPVEAIIKKLLQTQCTWWTVELQDPDEALSTRSLIEETLLKISHEMLELSSVQPSEKGNVHV